MRKYKIWHTVTGETHVGSGNTVAAILKVYPATISKAVLNGGKVSRYWRVEEIPVAVPIKESRECKHCKKMFIPNSSNQIYCDVLCAQIATNERRRKEYQEAKENPDIKPKKKPKKTLAQTLAEAEKLGMKYGDYVAMTEYGMKIEK